MNKKFLNYFIVVLLFKSILSFAQVKDAGLWASIELEKKINQKIAFQLSENIRWNENITEIGTSFTEVGADYRLLKNLKFGVTYRFSQKKQVDDFYSLRHRYAFNASYKLKIKKININVRAQLQSRYKNIHTDENGKIPNNYLRYKVTLKYNLERRYTPFISTECWNQLNNIKGNQIDKIRYQIGVEYEINKFSSLTLSYIINQEINVNNPWTSYITNITYNYSF